MTRILTAAVAICVFAAGPVRADEEIDAKTKEILKKVGALYKAAKSMHADLAIEGSREAEGQEKQEFKVKATIDMKRPNMFALRTTLDKDENAGPDVVSDGKNLVIFAKRMKQYTEKKAPAKMADIG